MAKFFNIVLIILGFASLINGFTWISSSLFMAAVNLLAALILLYVGFNMVKSRKQDEKNNNL